MKKVIFFVALFLLSVSSFAQSLTPVVPRYNFLNGAWIKSDSIWAKTEIENWVAYYVTTHAAVPFIATNGLFINITKIGLDSTGTNLTNFILKGKDNVSSYTLAKNSIGISAGKASTPSSQATILLNNLIHPYVQQRVYGSNGIGAYSEVDSALITLSPVAGQALVISPNRGAAYLTYTYYNNNNWLTPKHYVDSLFGASTVWPSIPSGTAPIYNSSSWSTTYLFPYGISSGIKDSIPLANGASVKNYTLSGVTNITGTQTGGISLTTSTNTAITAISSYSGTSPYGVYGQVLNGGIGVGGFANSGAIAGVYGYCPNGAGVKGSSSTGYPLLLDSLYTTKLEVDIHGNIYQSKKANGAISDTFALKSDIRSAITTIKPYSILSVTNGTTILTTTYNVILCNAGDGNVILTLPNATTCANQSYIIKKTDSSANTVTINPVASQNIDSQSSLTESYQSSVYQIISDGSQWWIISLI